MNTDVSKLTTHDGLTLNTHKWQIAEAKADIYFVHGFFEHSGRYQNEARYFNNECFNFYAYDQRSHGLSEGKLRSYISSFDNYLTDYRTFLSEILDKSRPYFLFAHSMGGLVLCSYLLDQKTLGENFRGAIFSSPLLMPDKNTAPLLQKLSGIIGTLLPRLKVVAIDSSAVSRDPNEVAKYSNDPLIYTDKMYAGSAYQLLKQMKTVQSKLESFTHPFLVLHGTDDKLAEIDGSRLLYKKATSKDKEFVQLIDYKHEITKDLGKEKVLATISSWMNQRLA